MKKIFLAAIAAASVSGPVLAQSGTVLGSPQFGQYDNRGQCQSALAAERNAQRADPARRGAGYRDLSGSEFNRASLTTTRCEERNGKWVVVFYQNGFPS